MSSPKPALATGCARRSERFRFLMVATIGRLYDMRSRSRDAHAPEVCPSHFKKALPTREAERRQARILETAPAGAAAPSVSSAFARKIRRGLASRRSTAALATQINAMAQPRPGFLGRAAKRALPAAAVPVQRGTSRTGRNAGRLDTRTAREQGYKPRPQEPHPPHRSAVTGRRPSLGETGVW